MNNVVKANGVLGDAQTNRAWLACGPPALSFARVDRAAFTRVKCLAVFGFHSVSFSLQIFFSAETQIGFVFMKQAVSMFFVNIQAVGLTIRNEGAADVGAFVPIKTEPFQVGDELVFIAGLAAFDIGVLDAQYHGAAFLTRIEPIE
jgi:hypothetical protein